MCSWIIDEVCLLLHPRLPFNYNISEYLLPLPCYSIFPSTFSSCRLVSASLDVNASQPNNNNVSLAIESSRASVTDWRLAGFIIRIVVVMCKFSRAPHNIFFTLAIIQSDNSCAEAGRSLSFILNTARRELSLLPLIQLKAICQRSCCALMLVTGH